MSAESVFKFFFRVAADKMVLLQGDSQVTGKHFRIYASILKGCNKAVGLCGDSVVRSTHKVVQLYKGLTIRNYGSIAHNSTPTPYLPSGGITRVLPVVVDSK